MQSPMVLGKVVEARHNKMWVVAMFIASSSISQVFNLDARAWGGQPSSQDEYKANGLTFLQDPPLQKRLECVGPPSPKKLILPQKKWEFPVFKPTETWRFCNVIPSPRLSPVTRLDG